jgi:hypothetical protein
VAACRGALNADRFEISDHGADGAAFSFHAAWSLSQSGMPAISSMSPDPAITFRRGLA